MSVKVLSAPHTTPIRIPIQVENMCGLVSLGSDWFGFIYSWSDNKKKSSLMLSGLHN